MNSLDWEVLSRARCWLQEGHRVHLFTVVQTWGSAPRLPGAILAIREDGQLCGSVSGGCIEDDLADKARSGRLPQTVAMMEYGVSRDEAQHYGIPCGGRLQIFVEPLKTSQQLTLFKLYKVQFRHIVKPFQATKYFIIHILIKFDYSKCYAFQCIYTPKVDVGYINT